MSVLPKLPPNSVWYQTLPNVGSEQNGFFMQLLAMPLSHQVGKVVRSPMARYFTSNVYYKSGRREGEGPHSEDLLLLDPHSQDNTIILVASHLEDLFIETGEFTIAYRTKSSCSKLRQCPSYVSAAAQT